MNFFRFTSVTVSPFLNMMSSFPNVVIRFRREEYQNRIDYTWGYKKTIIDDKNFEISDYFIKSQETVEFNLRDNDIFKIVSGNGLLIGQDQRVMRENETAYAKGKLKFKALSNSVIETIISRKL